uniref:Uncharacterized protein n=1 Tax=Paravannella minima TaxID=1443144 RepID=A0A411K7M8_9EUKA|nr:hypothetical protein [Paravannella minima]QBC73447.1 hypothetical protein [Paravannella minima]
MFSFLFHFFIYLCIFYTLYFFSDFLRRMQMDYIGEKLFDSFISIFFLSISLYIYCSMLEQFFFFSYFDFSVFIQQVNNLSALLPLFFN